MKLSNFINLLLFIFLTSCSTNNLGKIWDERYQMNEPKLSFNQNLSFDEFDILLNTYVEDSKYPDIRN